MLTSHAVGSSGMHMLFEFEHGRVSATYWHVAGTILAHGVVSHLQHLDTCVKDVSVDGTVGGRRGENGENLRQIVTISRRLHLES
jgi:hypothetical protein